MPIARTLDDLIEYAIPNRSNFSVWFENLLKWNSVKIGTHCRDRELQQLQEFYRQLKDIHERTLFSHPDIVAHFAVMAAAEMLRATGAPAESDVLLQHAGQSAAELLRDEIFFDFPHIDFAVPLSLDDTVALRAYMEHKRQFLLNAEAMLREWAQGFTEMWVSILKHLPDEAFRARPALPPSALILNRPMWQAMANPAEAIEELLVAAIRKEHVAYGLFAGLRNTIEASYETADTLPSKSREPKDRLPDLYLGQTPFRPLFDEPLPLIVTKQHRFEHCHIVAGTGHGKTQLMQSLMLADFDDPDRPSVVAIDSQGDMLKTLSRLERFNPDVDDRLIILDPADTDWPLRLNLFDVNRDTIAALPRGEREQLLAGIIELYEYIFGALLGAELTQKQSVVFSFLAQLMLAIPNATIHTLRQLLEDPTPYWTHIETLPTTARTFLTEHLFASSKRSQKTNDYNATRSQILRRLYGILSNPAFERIFSHPRNALDMKQALDDGKIILVNTAKDVLKSEASAIFGRYVIALILRAALERASEPKETRRPAFVYIDEAADYFDTSIDTLLIQARKYNVGITIAHQFLDQLTPALRASVMSNPAIRFAGGLSSKDAAALKEDMRTSAEFLLGAKKRTDETEFACFVRNLTPTATTYRLPFGRVEREPRMSEASRHQLLARNRVNVAAPIAETDALLGDRPQAPAAVASDQQAVAVPADPEAFEDRY